VHSKSGSPRPTSKAGPVIATVAGDGAGWMTTTLRGDRFAVCQPPLPGDPATPERSHRKVAPAVSSELLHTNPRLDLCIGVPVGNGALPN